MIEATMRLWINPVTWKRKHTRIAISCALVILVVGIMLCVEVIASSYLGDYASERSLGDGTGEVLMLSSGDGPVVLGSGPVVSTQSATNVSLAGGGVATLNGTLSDLNGSPQADVSFAWGYSVSSLPNTLAVGTVAATGSYSALLSGFDTTRDVYYQFVAGTDGTSRGSIVRIEHLHDAGFILLHKVLPIIVALVIIIAVFMFTGNPLMALVMATVGLISFSVIQALINAIT